MKVISIVLPAYNEELMIPIACARLGEALRGMDYELIFVDDGSADSTWRAIEEAGRADSRVRGVGFSRNFGKDPAMLAGLEIARGDACVVMDCDMQHPPSVIPEMVRLWEQGYKVVVGRKTSRGRENPLYRGFSKLFYTLISAAAGTDLADTSDFQLLDREVVTALLSIPEHRMFFRAMSAWVGYPTIKLPFAVEPRQAGKGKWRAGRLIRYALENLTSFSTAPMQLVTVMGVLTFAIAVGLGIHTLYKYITGAALGGFTTVILLLLFFFSMVMISLGIIGHYIARIFEAVKARPRYIVDRKCN